MRGVEVFTGKQNGLFAGLGETTTSAVVLDCMRTKHFCTWVTNGISPMVQRLIGVCLRL